MLVVAVGLSTLLVARRVLAAMAAAGLAGSIRLTVSPGLPIPEAAVVAPVKLVLAAWVVPAS
jgi:hypothetical protein